MSPQRGVATISAVGVLVLALAACGTAGGDYPTAAPGSAATATESDTPTDSTDGTDSPPFPANTDPDTQDASVDAMMTVTDVRVGQHEGFDRIVLVLGGTGAPGWRVEYVDEPLDDGSGNPADVAGDAYLQVMVSGTGYPMDTGVEEYAGPNPVAGDGEVTEVLYRGVFEGYTQVFVGVDGAPRPFRVFSLEDPARVVVDVHGDD